jgi:hypothetical protein
MNEHIKAHEINNNNGKNAAGSQVHVCPFELCRKKFFRLSKYQDHLNTHTRIEPYECQHCHKKFTGRYRRNEQEKVIASKPFHLHLKQIRQILEKKPHKNKQPLHFIY